MNDEDLKLYAEMVTKIRSRFEIDQRKLVDVNIDTCSQHALDKIKRKVKLNRGKARKM